MKAVQWSKRFMAASVILSMLFTGNSMTQRGEAAVPAETLAAIQPTSPPETSQPTIHTQPTIPPEILVCEQIAEEADGKQLFVYDATAGQLRYCKGDEAEKMYPASITKLYTAAVALMYLRPEQIITAGDELALMQPGSSRAYVTKGCRLTAEMLMEAMLIPSGNDAAYVVAAAAGRVIAGEPEMAGKDAVAVFIEEMNRQGENLGFVNSHFVNPDGYHDENHYTCPRDAALMATLALQEPVIEKYMAMQQDSVTFASGERITWYNTNHLINPESPYYMECALGLKTGYTDEAGQCLLAAFREEEQTYVVGIFGSEGLYRRYDDAAALYEAWAQ